MWEIYTRQMPYADEPHFLKLQQKILSGLRPPVPADAPAFYSGLMCACWTAEPSQRPIFKDIVPVLESKSGGLK